MHVKHEIGFPHPVLQIPLKAAQNAFVIAAKLLQRIIHLFSWLTYLSHHRKEQAHSKKMLIVNIAKA